MTFIHKWVKKPVCLPRVMIREHQHVTDLVSVDTFRCEPRAALFSTSPLRSTGDRGGRGSVLLHHLERKFRARQKDRERGLLLFSHRTTPRIGSAPPRSRSGGPPQGGSLNPLHQPSQAARRPCKDTTASPAHTRFRTRTQAEYIIDAHPTRVEPLRLWTRLPSPSTQSYAY